VKEKAAFFDRDGVINKVIYKDGRPESPRTLDDFILNDGIKETVRALKGHGFRIIVVSNQPDVARGRITQGILDLMTQRMQWDIHVDEVCICPHDDHHQCSCRKPKPGMLMEAASRWKVDLSSSFMIGDTWKDMEAGKAAGCKTILLDAPYNKDVSCDCRAKSLLEAVGFIVKTSNL
jgi:D-glycero-D-manno-heptose 1,7-bisphosphate phosphatase